MSPILNGVEPVVLDRRTGASSEDRYQNVATRGGQTGN